MPEKTITRLLLALIATALVVSSSFVLLLYQFAVIEPVYVAITIVVFTAITFGYFSFVVRTRFSVKKQYEELVRRETYPMLFTNASKEISILNPGGDAIIKYGYDCRNTSEGYLERIVHSIEHDGHIGKLEGFLNDRKITIHTREYVARELTPDGNEMPTKLPHRLEIVMDLKGHGISPLEQFSYVFRFECKKAHPELLEGGHEFTAFTIFEPTVRLLISLSAPPRYRFAEDGIDLNVVDHFGTSDLHEQTYVRNNYPPKLIHDGRIIILDVQRPKISSTYRLYFQLKPE